MAVVLIMRLNDERLLNYSVEDYAAAHTHIHFHPDLVKEKETWLLGVLLLFGVPRQRHNSKHLRLIRFGLA